MKLRDALKLNGYTDEDLDNIPEGHLENEGEG